MIECYIVGICGASGSGKSSASDKFEKKLRTPFPRVPMDNYFLGHKCYEFGTWERPEGVDGKECAKVVAGLRIAAMRQLQESLLKEDPRCSTHDDLLGENDEKKEAAEKSVVEKNVSPSKVDEQSIIDAVQDYPFRRQGPNGEKCHPVHKHLPWWCWTEDDFLSEEKSPPLENMEEKSEEEKKQKRRSDEEVRNGNDVVDCTIITEEKEEKKKIAGGPVAIRCFILVEGFLLGMFPEILCQLDFCEVITTHVERCSIRRWLRCGGVRRTLNAIQEQALHNCFNEGDTLKKKIRHCLFSIVEEKCNQLFSQKKTEAEGSPSLGDQKEDEVEDSGDSDEDDVNPENIGDLSESLNFYPMDANIVSEEMEEEVFVRLGERIISILAQHQSPEEEQHLASICQELVSAYLKRFRAWYILDVYKHAKVYWPTQMENIQYHLLQREKTSTDKISQEEKQQKGEVNTGKVGLARNEFVVVKKTTERIHFIPNDEDREKWSKILDGELRFLLTKKKTEHLR